MIPLKNPCPLSLKGVEKVYGDFRALGPVDLEIAPGEIFALLGPNGAGKSTMINSISGVTRQTAGTIDVFGYDTVKDFRTTRRLVGLVPQEINFDPFFTPHECLMIQMGLMGRAPDAAYADSLLERVSLLSHRNAYTRNLSGGMKRRLLIAKALVHEPRLLFLDEPTAGVDVELRKDLWTQVLELKAQGVTIILTTHYLEEAEKLADRVGVINHGRLVLVEDKHSLMSRYESRRVRIRMASPPDASALPEHFALVSEREIEMNWTGPTCIAGALEHACAMGEVEDVSILRTNLEDIFVDLIHESEANAAGGAA
jgi:ABC-2 type transport system ATP-binding protein